MRALATVAAGFFLIATPTIAASPEIEAAVKLLQSVGSDPARLDKFCKAMRVVDAVQARIDRLEAQVSKLLDDALGANFKTAREAVNKIGDAADDTPDSKALNAALDDVSNKCPD